MSNQLKLSSPAGADPVIYYWPLCKTKQYNGAEEILETIKWVTEDYPELKIVLEKYVLTNVDLNSYDSMKQLCDKYNKGVTVIRNLWKGATKPNSKISQWASPALLRHIITQCYNRSVVDPDKLNQYEPFSPEVYGETSFELISKMLEDVKLTEDDIFVDLGSGVGQVVIQVAASSKVSKCIGIEKSDVPSEFAANIEKEFKKWMKWYGKKYQEFELIKGDFFESNFRDTIMNSSLIFVNNFAFGPEVDHKLKLIFAEMKDGTKIVSSKAFCPINFRITDRHMTELGSIMNVKELSSMPGAVSWTGKPVTYFLHTIDRRKLESYFNSVKNNGNGSANNGSHHAHGFQASSSHDAQQPRAPSTTSFDSGSCDVKSPDIHESFAISSSHNPHPKTHHRRTSSKKSVSNDEEEGVVYGPTTRRQWSSWVAQQERIKRKNQDKDVPTRTKKRGTLASALSSRRSVKSPITIKSTASSENDQLDDDNSSLDDRIHSPRGHRTPPASLVENPPEHHIDETHAIVGNVAVSPITSVDEADQNSSAAPSSPAESLPRPRKSLQQQPARKPGRPRKLAAATADVVSKADATKRKYRRRHHHAHQKFSHKQNLTPRKLTSATTSEELIRRRESQTSTTKAQTVGHPKKKSAEWIETLDLFHKQIVYNAANANVEASDGNAVVPSVSKIQSPKSTASLISPTPSYLPVASVNPLTTFMENIRKDYEQFLSHMQSSDFRNEIMIAIENEQKRQKSLQHRKELLEKQVQILQEEGTQLLTVKLQELDMKVVTPTELLSKAKEIVIQHQDLQARAAALENEVKNLELQNQQLLALTKSSEEAKNAQTLNANSGNGDQSHDDAKKAVLVEIGSLFTHRKAYLNEISRMENEIRLLESLVQINAANAGLSESSILKSPLASIAGLSQTALHQTPLNVLSSPVISTNKSGNSPTSAAVAAAQHSRAALAKDPSLSASNTAKDPKSSGRNAGGDAAPPTSTTAASSGRRLRGGRTGRGGSTATGLRRKHTTATSQSSTIASAGGSTASSGGTSSTHGAKTTLDVQRRDDIDEQVEEMVRKIKNMNSAVTSNLTTASQERDKKSKTPVSSSFAAVASSAHSPSQKADGKKLPRRREKKQTALAASTATPPIGTISASLPPITAVATAPAVASYQPSTIEQTVDAVSHGFSSSSSATAFQNVNLPSTLSSAFAPTTTLQSVANISQPLATNEQSDAAERWQKGTNAESLSSVTDSLPSPDQETLSSAQNLVISMPKSVDNQFVSGEQDVPLSLVTSQRRPSSVPVFPCYQSSILQQTAVSSSSAPPTNNTVVVVQPPPCSSASSSSCQAPSPFSIGALLIDERPASSSSNSLTAISTLPAAKVDGTPGNQPRRVQSASARIDETSSVHDSGYAESLASTATKMEFEPAKEKIPSPNLFKNTSNTGQPGNPHEYSNPGNPQVKQRKSIGLASTSSGRSPSTPAKKVHGVVADYPSPQDVIESKTLLNPSFRIPRRVAKTPASTSRVTEAPIGYFPSHDTKRPTLQPLMTVRIAGADSRSPLASRLNLGGRERPMEKDNRKRRNWQYEDSNTPKRRLPNAAATTNSFNPVDQIMQDMILPTKKHEEKDSQTSSISSDSDMRGKRSFPRNVDHSSSLSLTRESLEKHVSLTEGHHFIKQGLMEALLEHKMASGRVESYSVLAPKLDRYFSKTNTPVKYDPIVDDFESQHSASRKVTGQQVSGFESQECDSIAKRGPKTPPCTPPGSPPFRKQRVPSRSPISPISSYSNEPLGDNAGVPRPHRSMSISSAAISTSPLPTAVVQQPPHDESDDEVEEQRRKRRRRRSKSNSSEKFLQQEQAASATSKNDILRTLAGMANIEPSQVSQLLSADALKALQGLDPAILVATLSTLLGTIMQNMNKKKKKSPKKKESHAADDASSSKHQVPHISSTCEMDEAQPSTIRAHSQPVEEEMDLVESSSSHSSAAVELAVRSDVPSRNKRSTAAVVLPPPTPPVERPMAAPSGAVVHNFPPPAATPKVVDLTRPPPPIPPAPPVVDFSVPPPVVRPPAPVVDFSKPPPMLHMPPPQQATRANNDAVLNDAIYKLNVFTMNILYQLPHDALSYLGADIVDYQPLDRFFKDYNHEHDAFFGRIAAVQPPSRPENTTLLPPQPSIIAPPLPSVKPPPAPLVVPIRHTAPQPKPADLMSQPILPPFPLPAQRNNYERRRSDRNGSRR